MDSIIKYLLSPMKIFLRLDFIFLFILAVLFLYSVKLYEPIKIDAPILKSIDSLNINQSEIKAHNLNLLSILQERESLEANSISSEMGGLLQIRSIYMGIISAILTFVITKQANNRSYIIIVILIAIFYALDIHLEEMIKRSNESKKITSTSLEYVVTIKPDNNIWYELDYKVRNDQFINVKETRVARKIHSIFFPNAIQIIFFILPGFIIYMLATLKYRKQ